MATFTITAALGDTDYTMCIYKITNNTNGKSYIGQSKSKVRGRWYKHIRGDKSYKNSAIHNAIAKYGVDNFTFTILDICETVAQMDYKEKLYIKQLNSLSPNGYNITTGGGHGFEYTVDHKLRLSESAKNKDKSVHKKHSEFMKQRMNTKEMKQFMAEVARRTHTGRKQPMEQVEHRANLKRGSTFSNEQKITLARAHMDGRVIVCSNGNTYLSAYEASLATGAIQSHIGSICNGKRKSSKGFRFWYGGDE